MAYINEDELLEVTPQKFAPSKMHLCPHERKLRGHNFFTKFYYLAISVAPPWAPDHLIGSFKKQPR